MTRKYALILLILLMQIIWMGCIRVAGTAYYTKPNESNEDEVEVKKVGFDTNKILPSGQDSVGSIEIAE